MTTIAFVCAHNAGRSQMAAAFARQLAPFGVDIVSGGTDPGVKVNPVVVEAMLEKNIDLRGAVPRKLAYDESMSADYFVTMGCSPEEACPAGYRGDTRDWDLPDPKGKSLDEVRAIRDEIERRVKALLDEVGQASPRAALEGGSR